MHLLAERVLSHTRRENLLRPGDRVGVAVSGGVDSVALLRILVELRDELGIVLSVVHFNHKLRGVESEGDEQFVAGLARTFALEFICDFDDVAGHARDEGLSLETAARELRYGFFRHLIRGEGKAPPSRKNRGKDGAPTDVVPSALDKIATGHTLDDQAETVLMRLIRGAGLRGIGGIHPRIPVEDDDGDVCGEIVRSLLNVRRRELEQYLNDIGQDWREDATNSEAKFTRNRVRKLVVPLLEKEFNPAVAENLAELADIARGEEDFWENEVAGWMGTAVHWSEPEWARVGSNSSGLVQISSLGNLGGKIPTLPQEHAGRVGQPTSYVVDEKIPTSGAQTAPKMGHPDLIPDDLTTRIRNSRWLVMNASVDRLWFLSEPVAVQRRLVKAIGEQAGIPLEFKHVDQVVRFAHDADGGKELDLPLGWKVARDAHSLLFLTPDLRRQASPGEYEHEFTAPGRVAVNDVGSVFELRCVPASEQAGYNPEHLLDASAVTGPLRVRNWRPGDRYWPAHTKSPKKIKELLQERHLAQPERKLWPVVACGDEILWLKGFPPPAKWQAKPDHDAIAILETPMSEERASHRES